jgi:hypothetical protein
MNKALKAGFLALLMLALLAACDRFVLDSAFMHRLRAHHWLRRELWSIGIVHGETPFELSVPDRPILRARDITDTAARMVADPFAVQSAGIWYLFFEIDSVSSRKGEIGLAISTNTVDWSYQGIVLKEPFHLSYPCVFEWEGEWYMIPESHKANAIRLYRADPFPSRWTHAADLIEGPYKDPTPVRHADRWWIFATSGQNETMDLFYAEELTGPWQSHAKNPVIDGDRTRARCGGRARTVNGRLIRFAQDCLERYGHRLLGFEVTVLTPDEYEEVPLEENPLLEPSGTGWNAHRMHHLDLHQTGPDRWIGFTDGNAN